MPNIVDDSRMSDKLRNANVIDIGVVKTQRAEQAARNAELIKPLDSVNLMTIFAVIGAIVILLFLLRRV